MSNQCKKEKKNHKVKSVKKAILRRVTSTVGWQLSWRSIGSLQFKFTGMTWIIFSHLHSFWFYFTILFVFIQIISFLFCLFFLCACTPACTYFRKLRLCSLVIQGEQGAQIIVVPELVEFLMSTLVKVMLFHLMLFTVHLS